MKLRTAGFSDPSLLQSYVSENPDGLNPADLESITDWQEHGFTGNFMVYQLRKDGCLFSLLSKTESMKIYQVHGLTQPIEELLPFLPCHVKTRLLPFRGRIVTDGFLSPLNLRFNARTAREFMDEVKEHIAIHGIITSLPPDEPGAAVPDTAALLKHYLSTAASRRDYASQIESLRRQSPALNILYLQVAGKQHGKSLKASLKAKGVTRGHFAVLEDTILCGAVEKETAAAMADQLAPPYLLDGLVWIRI